MCTNTEEMLSRWLRYAFDLDLYSSGRCGIVICQDICSNIGLFCSFVPVSRVDMQYDVFVSYNSEDLDWVLNNLFKMLLKLTLIVLTGTEE